MLRATSLGVAAIMAMTMWGCAGTGPVRDAPHPADLVVSMLDRHLQELGANLGALDKQMDRFKSLPDTPDPTIREIRALDLAGWELHREQWKLQQEHFRFAKAQLERIQAHPDEKSAALAEWRKHEETFESALDGFRKQRHELERKRLAVEAQIVERYLR